MLALWRPSAFSFSGGNSWPWTARLSRGVNSIPSTLFSSLRGSVGRATVFALARIQCCHPFRGTRSRQLWRVFRGPASRQRWRRRCFAAADERVGFAAPDTSPLGRVLRSTGDTRWYSFKQKDLRAFGIGQYRFATCQYPCVFYDLTGH